MHFSTLCSAIFLTIALVVKGSPAAEGPVTYQSIEEFNAWLTNTDAEITFVGDSIDRRRGVTLESRSALNTIVTYCNKRSSSICGGICTVYNGGARCLSAPGTECLSATHNVAFCSSNTCDPPCNPLSTCGTRLDNGFCYTPNTQSINVSTA